MKWESKTVAELRAAAKKRGLKGYWQWSKDKLVAALAKEKTNNRIAHPERPRARSDGPVSTRNRATKKAASPRPLRPLPASPAPLARSDSDEQRIEDAKFAITGPGVFTHEPDFTLSLHEPVDILPPLPQQMLGLLAQKPGILHGYWVLEPGMLARRPSLHLRLSRVSDQGIEVLEEILLPNERGYWYFHISEALDVSEIYLQLGHYDQHGHFVTALPRGIVRTPSLKASTETDRQWWVSEARFREMYLRGGGAVHGSQLRWPGSRSSFSSR